MKIILSLYFVLFLNIINAQKIDDGFLKIPDSLIGKNKLIARIVPDKKYQSWEFIDYDSESLEKKIIFKFGKYLFEDSIIDEGIFYECAPDYNCFNYLRIKEYKKKQLVITKEQGFRNFLGKIDNLEEALLLIKTFDYGFDKKFAIGGSYKIEKKFIFIYCTSYLDYGMMFYKLKINRVSQEIIIEKEGKIEGKSFPVWIS